MVKRLEVWLQSKVEGRKANQVDLRFVSEFLVLAHDLARMAVHRRLAVLSVHHAGELFQLLQHMTLQVLFLTELSERFIKVHLKLSQAFIKVHLKLFQASRFSTFLLPFEGTGAVFSTKYIHPTKRRTVVLSRGYCEIREVD